MTGKEKAVRSERLPVKEITARERQRGWLNENSVISRWDAISGGSMQSLFFTVRDLVKNSDTPFIEDVHIKTYPFSNIHGITFYSPEAQKILIEKAHSIKDTFIHKIQIRIARVRGSLEKTL